MNLGNYYDLLLSVGWKKRREEFLIYYIERMQRNYKTRRYSSPVTYFVLFKTCFTRTLVRCLLSFYFPFYILSTGTYKYRGCWDIIM